MADDMVERVRIAIQAALFGVDAPTLAKTEDAAIAAIEAMREPTYRMRMVSIPRLDEMTYRDRGDLWKKQVDAALSRG